MRSHFRILSVVTGALALAAAVLAVGPAASELTNGSFEELDAGGRAAGWELLGNARIETDAERHSGSRALHLVRAADTAGEVGLNRAWEPNSGEQGAMLSPLKGGLRFWYKAGAAAPESRMRIVVIAMDGTPREVAPRVMWTIPSAHCGDGQWHEALFAYNVTPRKTKYSAAKWVHVGARLDGGACELWLDDIQWVLETGPILVAENLDLYESPGREGEQGTVTLTARNLGDRAIRTWGATLELPDGLTTSARRLAGAELEPGDTATLDWTVTGRRDQAGRTLKASVDAKDCHILTGDRAIELKSGDVVPVGLRCSRMVLQPGEAVTVELLAGVGGNLIVNGPKADLTAPAGCTVEPLTATGTLRPGVGTANTLASWRVTAAAPAPCVRLRGAVDGAACELGTCLTVVELPPSVPAAPEGSVYARVGDAVADIGSKRVRLVLTRTGEGFGFGQLQVFEQTVWRTVACLPRLALLATVDQEVVPVAPRAVAESAADKATLVLDGTAACGGVAWRFKWEFTASPGRDWIGYSVRATPAAEARITVLEGPMLYAGEGAAPVREDAILPGLEWLVRGEASSNSLDIKPEHPDCVRYVPHPNKVTVPAVGVRLGTTTVGLFWDAPPAQPSVALAGPASVVFASPNRFEGHANHLMGLFLPAVGKGVAENARRATEPLTVPAGAPLEIRASLQATVGATDSLAVVDRWYEVHGMPEPLPYPRQDLKGEVAFSLSAYFKDRALWNPEWNCWYSDLIVGFRPTKGPATELALGAGFLGDGDTAATARELAASVLGVPLDRLADAVRYRASPNALLTEADTVQRLVASQAPDGSWHFGGEKAGVWPEKGVNYRVLGAVGASEVGLTAQNAEAVLNFALLSGDTAARDAGLKALSAMRAFTVPRAAQVWEVPVHTPDILASARASQAFLAGYRLTRDPTWLRDAVYWARTGLPFVYVWAPAEKPAMQGGTIPVFGATWYSLSWFGVLVQWNGLCYGEALYRLAEYDSSFPWRKVADNILRSAMYQQAVEGDRLGQWPDALSVVDERKGAHGQTPPCFRPSTVLGQALREEAGVFLQPAVTPIYQGETHVALRASARVSAAAWNGEVLTFTIEFAPPQVGVIEVIGIRRPTAVILDGSALAEAPRPREDATPGWTWDELTAGLEIRPAASARHTLEVRGAIGCRPSLTPPLRDRIEFDFRNGADGWRTAHDLGELTLSPAGLTGRATGGDPYLTRGQMAVEGTAADIVVVRLAAAGEKQSVSLFWTTDGAGYAASREIAADLKGDGTLEEIRLPVGSHAEWAGQTITGLRLDPGAGNAGSQVRIESLRLMRGGR